MGWLTIDVTNDVPAHKSLSCVSGALCCNTEAANHLSPYDPSKGSSVPAAGPVPFTNAR